DNPLPPGTGRIPTISDYLGDNTKPFPGPWTDTFNMGNANSFRCTTTTTFVDDTVNKVRLLRSTATSLNGTQRTVQVQLSFLAQSFQFAGVADRSNFYISGFGFPGNNPTPPSSGPVGPGGADTVNGNVFVGCAASQTSSCGQVYVGSPSSTCTGTTTASCAPT